MLSLQLKSIARIFSLLILSSVLLNSFAAQLNLSKESKDDLIKLKPTHTFLIMSQYAFIQQMNNGSYLLILAGVNPYITFLAEHPLRKAGKMKTSEFVRLWPKLFNGQKATQKWVHVGMREDIDGNISAQAISLSDPRFRDNNSLAFIAKINQNNPLMHDQASDVTIIIDKHTQK